MADRKPLCLTPAERAFWERCFESAFCALVKEPDCAEPFAMSLDTADRAIRELRKRCPNPDESTLTRRCCPRCHHTYDAV
jgi:hypothetical protein